MNTEQLQVIPISQIVISKTNPRQLFNDVSLKELSKSIAENGLQQAILVRPKGKKYELVFGERRLRATKLLKSIGIQARVKELTDKQALEIQLIENKERKDVHPLNEAISIQKLLEFKNNSIAEIARILARSESYVVQRLQLNKLNADWKKKYFETQTMTLSVALLVSKLSESDQNTVLNNATDYNDNFKSYKEIENYIQRNILRTLENSIFDTTEENIVPNVSACVTCVKRSGANKLLFEDVESDDVCFDSPCFVLKSKAQALKNINEAIELEESILFIQDSYNDMPKVIEKLVKSHKKSVLTQYKEFYNTFDKKGKNRVKAIWLSGSNYGRETFIELREEKEQAQAKKMADCTPAEKITKIKVREIRSKELDNEKIYANVMSALQESEELKTVDALKTTDVDKAMQRLIIFNSLNWNIREKVYQVLKINSLKDKTKKNIVDFLLNFSEQEMSFVVRQSIFTTYSTSLQNNDGTHLLRLFAEECKSVPIDKIEASQNEIATIRQNKQKERINALNLISKN